MYYQVVVATKCIHHDDIISFAILNTEEKEPEWNKIMI